MPLPEHNTPQSSNNHSTQIPLVVLVGPTAVGKTEISIQLAQRVNAEIISADSRLFYRGMDIGTAKPTPAERARVPHHLIDVANPDEVWSLATFQQAAHQAIAHIHSWGKLPLLVGGTGQYVWSVVHGWEVPRVAPNQELRSALETWAGQLGPGGLHARLGLLDPVAAANIDRRNVRRTIRALEVVFCTGRRFSDQRRRGPSAYRTLLLGLARPRAELYARIDQRIHQMIQNGLVEEVKRLLAQGYSPDLPSLSAIGYGEVIAHLQGQLSLEEAVTQIKRRTRQFVRRQANWFKPNDPHIRWFQVTPDIVDRLTREVQAFQPVNG